MHASDHNLNNLRQPDYVSIWQGRVEYPPERFLMRQMVIRVSEIHFSIPGHVDHVCVDTFQSNANARLHEQK